MLDMQLPLGFSKGLMNEANTVQWSEKAESNHICTGDQQMTNLLEELEMSEDKVKDKRTDRLPNIPRDWFHSFKVPCPQTGKLKLQY